jgi:hypothetical protein
MPDREAALLDEIRRAFARGDEDLGHELIAEAIERLEMPTEAVAAAVSDGLAAWRPVEVSHR